MTRIRVGIEKERSQEIDFDMPYDEICVDDIRHVIGDDKRIMGWCQIVTKELYRDALHIYLKHAYPDDDMQYYSKWAWMVSPKNDFWSRGFHTVGEPEDFQFPREVRFGCHCSGNTKLRCYPTGFMFDTNHSGDPQDIIDEVRRIKKLVHEEWKRHGIPVHGGN